MTDSATERSSLEIDDLAPDDPAWRALTASASGTTPVHHPTLSQVAALTAGCRWSALGAWKEGRLVGAVAVVVDRDDDIWPRSLAPYNGPLVAPMGHERPSSRHRHESMVAGALLDELVARHRSVRLRLRPGSIDPRRIIESGWALTSSFTYEVAIDDLDSAWRNIDDNRRRLIRRAERLGCTVQMVTGFTAAVAAEVNRLHLMMRDGYRTSTDLDAESWDQALQELLDAELARLFIVFDADGAAVAFVLLTNTRPISTLLATGADPDRLDSGAGALLRWRMFCELSSSGTHVVDMNGARIGPEGRLKASFGGELVDRWELSSPRRPPVPTTSSPSIGARMGGAARALIGRPMEGP